MNLTDRSRMRFTLYPTGRKIGLLSLALFIFLGVMPSYGQEASLSLVELNGISLDMNKRKLINSWGHPAKRERKEYREEIWYYLNENTIHPTDGILVFFKKGKVKSWKVVDNMYEEMEIWGSEAGRSP